MNRNFYRQGIFCLVCGVTLFHGLHAAHHYLTHANNPATHVELLEPIPGQRQAVTIPSSGQVIALPPSWQVGSHFLS